MLHKTIRKHVSRFHAHIQEHGHKRALIMIMSSMVMMFYPYFSTRADQVTLPSGGTIEIQYSPDDGLDVNTDVVATVVVNTASGFAITNNDTSNTYTFTENGTFVFNYEEEGTPGAIMASVDWIDKEAPTGEVNYSGDPATGPVTAVLTTSEDVIMESAGGPAHVFTENGTFLFTFEDPAGNTGSTLAEVTTIVPPQNIVAPDAFVVEVDPSSFDTDDYADVTISAIDLSGNILSGYQGGVFVEVIGSINPNDYTLPLGGFINFISPDMGVKTSPESLQIRQSGTYTVSVYDILDDDIRGESTVVVANHNTGTQTILTGITGTGIYSTCTSGQVTATVTGFNVSGVSVSNNSGLFTYAFTGAGTFTFVLQTAPGNTGSVTVTATTGMFANCSSGTITPPIVLTGITASVSYVSGTTVTATATGFNMAGVFAVNNSNSLSYTFTSPGSFTFALQTAGGNTGSVTATATTGMFTTGSTNTGTNNTGSNNTGTNNTGTNNTGVVCDAGDLILTGALGGVYSLTTPVVIGGLFSINWAAANNHCNPDQIVTVQLRDHNGQWITLGTGELDGTGLVFRSTGLAYTGLYSIFGTHASGSIYTYTGQSGQQLTGAYTVDTPYTIYAAANTGSYTGLWTGYQVRIINASGVNLLSGARPFTIDNTLPSATGFTFIIGGANASGVVGSGGTFTLSFVGSELLSNIQLLVNNTLIKSWTGGSSTGYSLTGGFGATNLAGPIAYVVNFTDAAGNTGSVTGTNIYTIDTIDPNFQAFAVSGSAASGVKFTWNTSKSTVYNLQFTLSGSTGAVVPVNTTAYATSHTYTTTALATSKTYLFSIKINDALQNTNFMSGTVTVNASGATSVSISTQSNNIMQLSAQVEAGLFAKMLRKEIENFEECKAELDINEVEIDLGANKKISFDIPDVSKKTTKTILSTFASVLTAKLKTANLTAGQLKEIENKSNNFFAVTALLQEGSCKQNLSAYHINLFENAMKQMKLQLFK